MNIPGIKRTKEQALKILNEILVKHGETKKVEFTYNRRTKLFYNIQNNTFISKRQLKKYNIKDHMKKLEEEEKYRKANYHYLKKDTELLIWNDEKNGWFSVRENQIIKIEEMDYVKNDVSKKTYSYYNNVVAKKVQERREKRKKEEEKNEEPQKEMIIINDEEENNEEENKKSKTSGRNQ